MGRVIDPLTKMGAVIESNNGKPPLKIFVAVNAPPPLRHIL
jgi:5-enolpyruvylshikimate-3-phosphate synthase